MHQQISESELVLMKIIWKNGGTALYAYIIDELEKESSSWKKNTVLTLLSRLIEKKYLKIRKIGHRNEYIALVAEQEYQTLQTHSFLKRVYGGSVRDLVSTLLRQDVLSADEMQEVERYWASLNGTSETDGAGTNRARTGSAETDGAEADGVETDSVVTDSVETDGARIGSAETDSAGMDSVETDGARIGSAETDSAGMDGVETDGIGTSTM